MSLEEAKAYVNETYDRNSCTGYTVLLEDGSHSGYHSVACYGGIFSAPVRKKTPVAVVNQLQTEYRQFHSALPKDAVRAYLDWVVNRSVFSTTFLEHDVDKIIQEGVWVTRCDIPGNVMVAAMTCLRALTENDRSCKSGEVFFPLVKAGCTEDFAFVVGHFMHGDELKASLYDSHHCIFDLSNLKIRTVINFLSKKFVNPRISCYSVDRNYTGVHSLFGDGGDLFTNWLVKAYKSIVDDVQELKKKDTNPFQTAKLRTVGSGIKMGSDKFEVMAKVCNLFYKEFIG